MFKCIDIYNNTYQLTIEYKGKELRYTAQLIQTHIGEETWWIKDAKKKMIQLIYNVTRKELREDLMPTQPSKIPEDFMEVLKEAFRNK